MPLRRDFLGFRFAISLFFVHGPRSGKLAKVINAKVGTMDWGAPDSFCRWLPRIRVRIRVLAKGPNKFASANRKRRTALAFLLNCELRNASASMASPFT